MIASDIFLFFVCVRGKSPPRRFFARRNTDAAAPAPPIDGLPAIKKRRACSPERAKKRRREGVLSPFGRNSRSCEGVLSPNGRNSRSPKKRAKYAAAPSAGGSPRNAPEPHAQKNLFTTHEIRTMTRADREIAHRHLKSGSIHRNAQEPPGETAAVFAAKTARLSAYRFAGRAVRR